MSSRDQSSHETSQDHEGPVDFDGNHEKVRRSAKSQKNQSIATTLEVVTVGDGAYIDSASLQDMSRLSIPKPRIGTLRKRDSIKNPILPETIQIVPTQQ